MTAIIIDDEPLARTHLRKMLGKEGVRVSGEAGDAAEGLVLAEQLAPDVVFLDVRMPGVSGIDAISSFAQLEPPPLVILVTGHSEYAVEAFDQVALDYILKPTTQERLGQAVAKARKQVALQHKALLAEATRRPARSGGLQRLPIREKGTIKLIAVDRIIYAMASDKTVIVKVKDASIRTTYTLRGLEDILPRAFMRIHSSCIVNLAAIEEIQLLGNHTYGVKVVTGEELPVGRQQYPKLQERLGFPPSV